jgi:AAA-like domain/CHAT domain
MNNGNLTGMMDDENENKIRILFLTAEPTDTARLRLGRELDDIKEKLGIAKLRERFLLEQRLSTRPEDISSAILNFNPHIVHFSGHGVSTGELCFENGSGKTQPVTHEALAGLFELVTEQVRCVVLNACYSDTQAKAIVQHIPFVIGMNKAIGDKAAIAFAVGFYQALGANRSIEDAYKFGCVEILLQRIPENLTPVLRTKEKQSPNIFYLERPKIERECYQKLLQPGSLIRIQAPRNMGKAWLMNRLVSYVRGHNYQTVILKFSALFNEKASMNLEDFLKSFCLEVSNKLKIRSQLENYWQQPGTYIDKTTTFVQNELLAKLKSPLVLALNDVDLVFEQSTIANSFCTMLRTWHDLAKEGDENSRIWQKLRLIIVHSTEVYNVIDINNSPLRGTGLVVDLPELGLEEVERFVKYHQLNWESNQVEDLMAMLGGHPYLLKRAIEYFKMHDITLQRLLKIAPTPEGPFSEHLLELLNTLRTDLELKTAFRDVVMAKKILQLEPTIARRLKRLGLVKLEGFCAKPRCELYRQYFRVTLHQK